MRLRFAAYWSLSNTSPPEVQWADTLEELQFFVASRGQYVREVVGDVVLCVTDRQRKTELWRMTAGGHVTHNTRSKYGRQAAKLFGKENPNA